MVKKWENYPARTWLRWRSLYQNGWSCGQGFFPLHDGTRILSIQTELVALSQSVWKHWTSGKSFWLQRSVVYIKPFTPRTWRTTTQAYAILEIPAMAPIIEFFLQLVPMEWILVVCKKISKKVDKWGRMQRFMIGGARCFRSLDKTSDEQLSRMFLFPILLQLDRLQLTAVCCNRRKV